MTATQAPGWYPDPAGGPAPRWWDGAQWTNHVAAPPPPGRGGPYPGGPNGQPRPTGPPPKQNRIWLWVVLGVGALFVLGLGGCAILLAAGGSAVDDAVEDFQQEQAAQQEEAAQEVTLTDCVADADGYLMASGELTNGSAKRSTYIISIAFVDGSGTQLDTTAASASNVEPGQRALWDASSFQRFDDDVTCEVVDVTRFASE